MSIVQGRVLRSEKLENALDNAVHDDAAAAREAGMGPIKAKEENYRFMSIKEPVRRKSLPD